MFSQGLQHIGEFSVNVFQTSDISTNLESFNPFNIEISTPKSIYRMISINLFRAIIERKKKCVTGSLAKV